MESDLLTSSRMFQFVFRMFSLGRACLPAEGMEAIPRQLAAGLPPESIRIGAKVLRVGANNVLLESGEEITARAVVVATDGAAAAKLHGDADPGAGQGVTCLYFIAPNSPVKRPMLVLNGDGRGPINNLCVPTTVAPTYGPRGESLVSVTVLGMPADVVQLESEVKAQLRDWFSTMTSDWRHLRTYRIPYALPRQVPPALEVPERPVRIPSGVYICGDHRDNASIQGAIVSGRRTAETVVEDFHEGT